VSIGADDVRRAAAAARTVLDRVEDGAAPVPAMGTDVAGVVAHVAACLSWYAHDLVAGPDEVSGADLVSRPGADLTVLLAGLGAWGEVLARVVDAAPPAERGFHPEGRPDAAGFAALGCAELLLHTDDIATGTGVAFAPPADLAAAVLDRLFPETPGGPDPWAALRWATGRGDLPGRPRRSGWRYAAAPAGERARTPPGTTGRPPRRTPSTPG
jgi:hypothetical protein